ncbi:MAG: chromate transporter, partial [Treponema sp.]|nr:chromate transporter [Treponema sp.]
MPEISLLELFLTFFYIGLFTIGGGLVAITLMQQTIVEKGFISVDEFYNMIAISESTPGPVGVNMATFLGYKFYGPLGAILASIAEVLPSLICILIIARFILKFRENAV